jgi:hypothetical protein
MASTPKPTNPNNPIMLKEPTGPRSRWGHESKAAEAGEAASRYAENLRDAGVGVNQT